MKRQDIVDACGDEEVIFLDGLDEAIVGFNCGFGLPNAIYDYDKIILSLIDDGMTAEEAVEYFGYNIAGAYVGERTPIVLQRPEE